MTKGEPDFMPEDVDGRHLFEVNTQKYKQQKGEKKQEEEKTAEVIKAYGTKWGIVQVPPVREALAKGHLKHEPLIHRFESNGVIRHDGTFKKVDAVIWCTGFKPALDHLKGLAIFENGRVKCKELQATDYPGLWFVGYGNWTGFASATLIGVGRTAKFVAEKISLILETSN
jgi:putative flavoprotein involved in K+ transport